MYVQHETQNMFGYPELDMHRLLPVKKEEKEREKEK